MVREGAIGQEEVASQTTPRKRSLTSYLSTILLVEACVFLYLLPRDHVLMSRVRQWFQPDTVKQKENQLRQLMKNDLPLGSLAPLIQMSPVNAASVAQSENKSTLLVFIGACTGCVEKYVKELDAFSQRRRDLRVVVVSQDSPENIRAFLKEKKLHLPIIADADGTVARAYNAAWFPRAYKLTTNGQIAWMQQSFGVEVPTLFRQLSSGQSALSNSNLNSKEVDANAKTEGRVLSRSHAR